MDIPNIFKQAISDTFYDKDIEVWTSRTITDDEGAGVGNGKVEQIDSFKGNFQFKTREKLQQEYGQEIKANAIITCDKTIANVGDIVVYNGKEYEITANPGSDSHTTLLVNGGD